MREEGQEFPQWERRFLTVGRNLKYRYRKISLLRFPIFPLYFKD